MPLPRMNHPGDGRIFPDSNLAKRLAVRAMCAYARFIPSHDSPLEPAGTTDIRILIQSMGGIGNTLMATPLIAETRRFFPNARIDLLTSPGAAELLRHDPNLSDVIEDPSAGGTRALVARIRAARYDAAMVALNAHLSKFALRIVFGRIPRRLMHGYRFRPYDDFSSAYTQVLERPLARHDVLCNLDLLAALTGACTNPAPLRLAVPDAAVNRAIERLRAAGRRDDAQSIALCQGSSEWMAFKRWPLDNAMEFAETAAAANPDRQIIVFCGPDEAEAVGRWRERFTDATKVVVMEPMPLPEYAAAIQQMNAVIANDSLPMHLAAAQQTPVVALFGPTDPALTGPWMGRSRIIQAEADYAPYYELPYPLDPSQFPDCMATIAPETVLHALDDLLNDTP